MKRKCLVGLMSLLLVVGFGAAASADWVTDPCDDAYEDVMTGKELEAAKVEFYPDQDLPDYVNLCIRMCDESTLPGEVIWEFDVDNNTATGGGASMTGIPVSPLPIKETAGFDLLIMKAHRFQGKLSAADPGQVSCFFKLTDEPCLGENDCFERGGVCTSASTNLACQTLVGSCDDSDLCSKFGGVCSDSQDAGIGRKAGEWYASLFVLGGKALSGAYIIDWGRDMPVPPVPGDGDSHCEKLPWAQIIEAVRDTPGYHAAAFDNLVKNPPYQVSIYQEPNYGEETYQCAGGEEECFAFGAEQSECADPGDVCYNKQEWSCTRTSECGECDPESLVPGIQCNIPHPNIGTGYGGAFEIRACSQCVGGTQDGNPCPPNRVGPPTPACESGGGTCDAGSCIDGGYGPCNICVALTDQDDYMSQYDDPTTADFLDLLPDGDGNMAPSEVKDGGLCHMYQKEFNICMDKLASGRELDYITCKEVCKYSGSTQGECEGNDCFWDAPKSKCRAARGPCEAAGCTFNKNSLTQAYPCMLDMCLSECIGEAIVGGGSTAISARESGRGSCHNEGL